jgi:ubiquinone/menaquinone biosynthesis C-methylase UbiE
MKMNYDNLAVDYAQHRRIHPGVFINLLRVSHLDSASTVLEVGCGTGNYIVAIQEAIGCACQGIDPSKEMLAKARSRNLQVRFDLGRAEKFDFPASTFDLVFSVDVIHHIGDCAAYYQQAFRILKPEGLVCTVTDSEEIIRSRQPLAHYFPESVEPEVNRYPRIPVLHQMMVAAGFQKITEARVEHRTAIQDIQAYRDKAFSSLYLIPQEAFERGIQRMEADLRRKPIPAISRYLLLWRKRSSK